MSIHTQRAIALAASKGAAAGSASNRDLWGMSKREMIEVMVRLAALGVGEEDAAFDGRGAARVNEEMAALKSAGII